MLDLFLSCIYVCEIEHMWMLLMFQLLFSTPYFEILWSNITFIILVSLTQCHNKSCKISEIFFYNCLPKQESCRIFVLFIYSPDYFHYLWRPFLFIFKKLQHTISQLEDLTGPCTLRKYKFISCVPFFSSCFHGNMTRNEGQATGSEVSNCTNENAPGSTQPFVL